MTEEKKPTEKNTEEATNKNATGNDETTTEEQFTEVQKWLLENNLPTFLDKLLEIQNIHTVSDIYNLDQDKIDTMIELIPQLPVTSQLKKALYRSSDRVIMDEMEGMFGKWRLVTEENKQLRKFNEVLIEQITEHNTVIKQLQQQNAKLTKDVLQATLALTQLQLHLVKQGISLEDTPILSLTSALNNSISSSSNNNNNNNNNNNSSNRRERKVPEGDEEEEQATTSARTSVVESSQSHAPIHQVNANENNNTSSNSEMKHCELCEMDYETNQIICVSNTCKHNLCFNCCKNSVTGDISNNQIPECPVCRKGDNHIDIAGTSSIWKNIVDPDIWTMYQGLSNTSV